MPHYSALRRTTGAKLRWLGVGGFELQHGENRILVDPYLSRIDYANEDKSINEKAKLDVATAVIDKHSPGGPSLVVPCHHDDMTTAFDDPKLPSTVGEAPAQELRDAASKLGLSTEVHNPKHLDWIEL